MNNVTTITKGQKKAILSLATTKGRREQGLFVAEGTKCVLETINAFSSHMLLCTPSWLDAHPEVSQHHPVTVVKRADILEMSSLSTPGDVMAVYHIPQSPTLPPPPDQLSLALDRIQDPGNLGTIIRIASWMGIQHIYCSNDTVDCYNPKVVQATMGAIARVNLHYVDLPSTLKEASLNNIAVYGTFLDGNNIYDTPLSPTGIIVMGNEGNGISPDVAQHIDHRLLIPSFPPDAPCIESLNVSVATAITVAEFRRQCLTHNI